MILVRLAFALGGLALAALIVWAVQVGDFGAAGAWLTGDPWGIVTLTDLYLGFAFLAVIIWLAERNKLIALVFILPLPLLGNVWAAIWLVWRLGLMARRLRDTQLQR